MATSVSPRKVDAAAARKLLENLQGDLRALSNESKRKYNPVKEAAESCMLKLRTISAKPEYIIPGLISASQEVLQPFILGCDTKQPKIVHLSLSAIQRLIAHEAVSMPGASGVIQCLWMLMEAGIEELKLLQTAILLITTNSVVQHESLAKALVLCFRLHFTKDNTTNNTAAATVRQLVTAVFERVVTEDNVPVQASLPGMNVDELKAAGKTAPQSLRPCAGDAYMLFQDLCQLVNADQPKWLSGMTEMTRTFGLELMESVLTDFPVIFLKHPEFNFLVKERVCPLVIKLFSPSLKYRQGVPPPPSPAPVERPYFPIVMRLLRIVSVLIRLYYSILVTECEIFLSLLVKFLDVEKPTWQRILALEVMNKLCTQPVLLKSFCQSYDMKQHSTKIFQDIVNAIGAFIQSQFMNTPATHQPTHSSGKQGDAQGGAPALVAGMPVGGGITPQPAFNYRGLWLPLIINISAPQGAHRSVYLEMLEKTDPPNIADGYGISLAFLCLLDIIRSVQQLVEANIQNSASQAKEGEPPRVKPDELSIELINSSWCGVMAALSLLLEASTDESATEAILKSKQTYASLCGKQGLNTPRDAFITALCKASLPPHYALAVLNIQGQTNTPASQKAPSGGGSRAGDSPTGQEVQPGNQVVAVGTPLYSSTLPTASMGPVMLTAKNIQCMRALLSVAHCHGSILGTAWQLVLTTLQHLVWILGLKPSAGGSLKPGQQATDGPNAVITTAVMADLPVLSAMLSRLFESSQYLDDVALHHLITALCALSGEAMEMAYNNKEPSLFAVAKLLETGLVNLPRLEVLWRPVTGHLLEVCQHPHQGLRMLGAEAVTSLIKAALAHKYSIPLHENTKLQALILAPLQELSGIVHGDIRQKQLECVLQLLHSNGVTLGQGWPLVLGVIGAVTNNQGEGLIRIAFQSLQLVVTDFLPIMPCSCLQLCVDAAAKFGLQNQELNISLTAIGLMWNISDYFYQNQEKIISDLEREAASSGEGGKASMSPFDALWMCLYSRLGDLCVDPRPAVRKSASQTLFSTISAHGDLLQQQTWHSVLWKVLFPLVDKVKELSNTASDTKQDVTGGGGNILIHHSRDTAQKQWAETRVMTMAGVARIFNTKRQVLQQLGDFSRAWALFLEYIESAAMCNVAEVSLAALKSFQEILQIKKDSKEEWIQLFGAGKDNIMPPKQEVIHRTDSASPGGKAQNQVEEDTSGNNASSGLEDIALWSTAWKVWLSIGTKVTTPPDTAKPDSSFIPSQPFLTALVQIFPALYEHIKSRFVASDLQKLSAVLQRALAVPVHSDSSPFIMPYDNNLTPLQEAILHAVKALHKEMLSGHEGTPTMYGDLFDQLLTFVGYAVKAPRFGKVEAKAAGSAKMVQADWVTMNFVPFAESVVELVTELYKATASHPAVISEHVLQHIVKTFRLPLGLKYGCPSQTTWILVIHSLLTVLGVGLPVARKHESEFQGMWIELGQCLEDFLFSQHAPPPTLSTEDYQRDEALDCKVIQLIRDEMLPYASIMPHQCVVKVMNILNQGSIHSATSTAFIDTDSSRKLREDFARACFETLLQFSFISKAPTDEASITRLAVTALLQRCGDVLTKYVEDERLSGKCPLPRARMSEISFVLKAVSTLLMTLKKAPAANVEPHIWTQVIDLYPALVDCTTSSSPQVCKALKEALQQYHQLLAPPTSSQPNGSL